jgi:hypothetical protein
MSGVIGSLTINAKTEYEKASQGLKHLEHDISSFGQAADAGAHHLSGLKESMEETLKGALGISLGTALVAGIEKGIETVKELGEAFVESLKETIEYGDQLSINAIKIGTSVQSLSELSFAAKMVDVDFEELSKGLTKLNQNLGQVHQSQQTKDTLKVLGLDSATLKAQDPTKTLEQIAEKIKELPTAADRSAAAMNLFGRSGANLLPMFAEGAEGIHKWAEEARKLGLSINDYDAGQLREANDAFKEMDGAIQGAKIAFTKELAPAVTEGIHQFTEWWTEGDRGMKAVAQAAAFTAQAVNNLKVVAEATGGVLDGIYKAAVLFGGGDNTPLPDPKPLEGAWKELADMMKEQADAQAKATAAAAAATAQQAAQQAKVTKTADEIDKLNSKWQLEADTMGMSARSVEMWKLAMKGATHEQLEQLGATDKMLTRMEAMEKKNKDAAKAAEDAAKAKKKQAEDAVADNKRHAKQIVEDSMTPLEKYAEKIKEIDDLRKKGFLTQEQAAKARAKELDGLDPHKRHDQKDEMHFAGAHSLNSAEAQQAIMSARFQTGGHKPDQQIANNTKKAADKLEALVALFQRKQKQNNAVALN